MSNPETQLAQSSPKVSALALMAGRFSVDPNKLFDTLKNTVFKGATNDELLALVVVSNEYGLNPLLKEIYAFPAKGGGIVPVVSIDGWLRMMNDHPQFDGLDYEWQHDGERLVACTSVIYRKDRSKPVRVTEYLAECKRGTEPWKMEHRMLRHKATIQGARVAFGFSGISDEDEAVNVPGLARDVTPQAAESKLFAAETPQVEKPKRQSKQVEAPVVQTETVAEAEKIATAQENLLDVPAKTLPDQVRELIKSSGVKWSEALVVLKRNQITDGDFAAPDDAPNEVLSEAIHFWPSIVKLVKGGAK